MVEKPLSTATVTIFSLDGGCPAMGQKDVFKITGMESVPCGGVFRGFSALIFLSASSDPLFPKTEDRIHIAI